LLRSAQSRTASGICDKRVPSFWAAGVLLWQPKIPFICVGGNHFKGPRAGVQLLKISSFVEEFPPAYQLSDYGIQANSGRTKKWDLQAQFWYRK
jgi:hypothetical protein